MAFVFQPWQLLLVSLAGWLNREQQAVVECLRTENQILKEALGRKRIVLIMRSSALSALCGLRDYAE
jgi:hypothetical protein